MKKAAPFVLLLLATLAPATPAAAMGSPPAKGRGTPRVFNELALDTGAARNMRNSTGTIYPPEIIFRATI